MYIPCNYSRRQTPHSSQTKMDNLITFYNFLDLTGVDKGNTLVSLSRASNVIMIMGFGSHMFPLVTGCHMLFCGVRLVFGRLQGGEEYMNQFLGCPGAQKKMT